MSEVKTLPTTAEPIPSALQAEPILFDVQALGFFKTRQHLLNAPRGQPVNQSHMQDRTTALVDRYVTLTSERKVARAETMNCLEATEGKNGTVVLKVLDRPVFNGLQDLIKNHVQEIMKVESAIRRLDSLGYGWYQDMSEQVSALTHLEEEINARMSQTATWVLRMEGRSGLSPQDILSNNPEYAPKTEADKELKAGKARLAELKPKLVEFDSILESAGV